MSNRKWCCFHSLGCQCVSMDMGGEFMFGNSSQSWCPHNLSPGASLLQGMESAKQAGASASLTGKGIGASAHQHQPSTVSIQRAKCVVEEAHVYVAGVSAQIPGASAASVNIVPRVTQPALKTGMCSLTPNIHKAVLHCSDVNPFLFCLP